MDADYNSALHKPLSPPPPIHIPPKNKFRATKSLHCLIFRTSTPTTRFITTNSTNNIKPKPHPNIVSPNHLMSPIIHRKQQRNSKNINNLLRVYLSTQDLINHPKTKLTIPNKLQKNIFSSSKKVICMVPKDSHEV